MSDPVGRLDGKVIIITGASQGLGEAAARLAASRGAAGLVLVSRDAVRGDALAAELDDAACRVVFVAAELAEPQACAEVLRLTDQTFGVVHGVVNAAAVTDRGSVWDTTVELWDAIFDVNVRAPFLIMQGAARIMARERASGSMVSIGSMTGHGGQEFLTPYAVSKGALHTLTRNLAWSLMRNGIRVNLLNLGWMATPHEDEIQRTYHGAGDDWLAQAAAQQPFGRLIAPEEVARAICFLLSDESGLMTGAIIDFDQSVLGAGHSPKPPPELRRQPDADG